MACIGKEEKDIQDFGWERDHLKDLNLDGKISLKCIKKGTWTGLDWPSSGQGQVWDVVNTIWTFLFYKVLRISLLAEELQASQEGLQMLCGSPLLQLTLQLPFHSLYPPQLTCFSVVKALSALKSSSWKQTSLLGYIFHLVN